MEPEGLLPHSKVPATSPFPEPAQSNPYRNISLPKDPYYFPSTPGFTHWSLSLKFPHQTPARLILIDFVTQKMLGEEHRSLSFSLRSFFLSPVTLSFLGPNILLNTLFSNTLSLLSSLNISDQVSHPHKTTGKIIVLCILIFKFLDSKLEDKNSALKDSKHSLTSICS